LANGLLDGPGARDRAARAAVQIGEIAMAVAAKSVQSGPQTRWLAGSHHRSISNMAQSDALRKAA